MSQTNKCLQTMPSKKIRTLFIITLHIFSHFARTFNLHEVYWLYLTRVTWISLTIYRLSYLYPRSPEGVYCFTSVRPSVQYIFRHIFLSKYWRQKSDIWSQVSYRYAILWEAFLDPSDSYFLFADFVDFYTHLTYICICTFFVAFFSATIDDRNLIFGHKFHIGMPYCGKRFWTRQIPTSCLPT